MDNFLQQMKQIVGSQDIHGIQITVEEGGGPIKVDISFKQLVTGICLKRLEIFETSSAYRDIIQAIAKVRSEC